MHDLVETSSEAGDIRQSPDVGEAMLSLRTFMFERVYLGEASREEHRRAHAAVGTIFVALHERPQLLPPGQEELAQRVTDFIAGMTDRYALAYAASVA